MTSPVCARDSRAISKSSLDFLSFAHYSSRFGILLFLKFTVVKMADEKKAAPTTQTFTSADRIRQLNDVDKVSVAIAELR